MQLILRKGGKVHVIQEGLVTVGNYRRTECHCGFFNGDSTWRPVSDKTPVTCQTCLAALARQGRRPYEDLDERFDGFVVEIESFEDSNHTNVFYFEFKTLEDLMEHLRLICNEKERVLDVKKVKIVQEYERVETVEFKSKR